jgi:Protein kinase domain
MSLSELEKEMEKLEELGTQLDDASVSSASAAKKSEDGGGYSLASFSHADDTSAADLAAALDVLSSFVETPATTGATKITETKVKSSKRSSKRGSSNDDKNSLTPLSIDGGGDAKSRKKPSSLRQKKLPRQSVVDSSLRPSTVSDRSTSYHKNDKNRSGVASSSASGAASAGSGGRKGKYKASAASSPNLTGDGSKTARAALESVDRNRTGRMDNSAMYATIKRRTQKGTTLVIEDFQLGEKLGKGAFGKVYKGLNVANGQFVAVKRMDRELMDVAELEREVNILKQLSHPNIVKYIALVPSANHLNLVLEYVESGSIAKVLAEYGFFPESLAAIYTEQVLLGLEYLHAENVVHRDIKGSSMFSNVAPQFGRLGGARH